MGKVDTCASSAREGGTYRWLVVGFFLATALRMLLIFVEDVVFGPCQLADGLVFLMLAVLSAGLGIARIRKRWH